MFIQSAELTAAPGKSGALGPMVTNMRDILSSETGKQWWSWAVLAGRPFGTQILSTRADGFADMVASQMKMIGSEKWAELSAEASGVLAHPAITYLGEVIAMMDAGRGTQFDPLVFDSLRDGLDQILAAAEEGGAMGASGARPSQRRTG